MCMVENLIDRAINILYLIGKEVLVPELNLLEKAYIRGKRAAGTSPDSRDPL